MRNNRFQIHLKGKTLNIAVTASGGKKCDPKIANLVRQILQGKADPTQQEIDNEATRYIHKLEKENEELRTKLTFSGTQDQSAEIEQLKAKVENLNAKLRDVYRENEVFHNEMTDAQNRTEEERESRVQMECGILNIIRKMGQS